MARLEHSHIVPLYVANVTSMEGAEGTTRTASVRVVFNPPTSGQVEVAWSATGISATDGTDYTITGDPLVVPAGTAQALLDVTIIGDNNDEPNETLDVHVDSVTGNAVLGGDVTGRITINDDDAAPRISVTDTTVTEGGALQFDVSLSAASGRTVTVRYATSRGTGAEAADFTNTTATLSFAPGETTTSVNVSTIGDNIDEIIEQVNLTLSTATNATILDNKGVGSINDDDTSVVTLTGVSVVEGNTSQRSTNFLINLSNPSDRAIVANLATTDGTAISTTTLRDFIAYNTNVTIAAGQTTKVVTLKVIGDRRTEPDETFSLTINSLTNGAIGAGNTTTGTIRNDD